MESGEERVYTVPFRKVKKASRKKRSAKAVKILKDFIQRHTKTEDIRIDSTLNEKIWEKGIENPPSKLRIRVKKEEDVATVYLAE